MVANYKASNVALKVSSLAEMACGRRLGDECLAVGFELIQVTAADHTSLADHLLNIACLHVKSRQPAQLRFHFLMKCKSQQMVAFSSFKSLLIPSFNMSVRYHMQCEACAGC